MADEEDEIKITPFDLEEELEEGEFDAQGNFVFRKEERTDDENNDTWAESVDWRAVEKEARERERTKAEQIAIDKKEEEDRPVVRDKLAVYKQMLRIMRPDETVQKTIRRLGDLVPKRRFRTSKEKSASSTTSGSKESADIADYRKKLDIMIELAHQLLEEGDTDIYQKNYEQLEDSIN